MRRVAFRIYMISVLAFLFVLPAQNSHGVDEVGFVLPWVPFGRDAGWYPAVEKGFYAAEGLKVRIDRGYGGADNIKKVAAGSYDIGGVDTGSLLLARDQGIKMKIVGMYHDKAPFVLRWMEGSGIKSLKDLEGKTVGAPAGDSNLKVLPALMSLNGLDFKKIKVINVDPTAREGMLVAGKLDAITGFHIQQPTIDAMAGKQGKKVKMTLFADNGIDVYGLGMNVTESYMQEKGEILKKFLRASVKSMAYSVEHPDEAVKLWLKHYPQADPKINRQVWDLTIDGMLTDEQMRLGIWRMDRGKWERTRDILSKGYGLKKKIPVEDLYTNEFLPTVKPPKRGSRTIARQW